MTAEIIQFKQKIIEVSGVCNTCEAVWQTEMPLNRYEMYQKQNKKSICPQCGGVDTDLARKINY